MRVELQYNNGELKFPPNIKLNTNSCLIVANIPEEYVVHSENIVPDNLQHLPTDIISKIMQGIDKQQKAQDSVRNADYSNVPEISQRTLQRFEAFDAYYQSLKKDGIE